MWKSYFCQKPESLPCIVVLEEVDTAASKIKGIKVVDESIRVDVFPIKASETSTREVLFTENINHGVSGFEGAFSKRFPLGDKHVYAFLRVPLEKRS